MHDDSCHRLPDRNPANARCILIGADAVGNSALGRTLSIMEKTTINVIGDALRERLPIVDTRVSKEMRRLIVQLERRQRELDQQRDQPQKREPH